MTRDRSSAPAASLALVGGRVHCLAEPGPPSEAVAVAEGRIVAVGTAADVSARIGPATTVIDLAGRAVIPGLVDAHAHLDREGLKGLLPSLADCGSVADIQGVIAGLAARAAPGDWIVTMPIGRPPHYRDVPGCLADGRFPTRWDLDRVAPDNPVYIRAIWGYWRAEPPLVSIANSRALALAGIDRTTEPPWPGIDIDRDPDSGEPTGIFVEHTMNPVVEHTLMAVAPSFTDDERVRGLRGSLTAYLGHGTTSVFEGHGAADQVVSAYRTLRARDELTVRSRLVCSPSWGRRSADEIVEWVRADPRGLAGTRLGDAHLSVSGLFVQPGRGADDDLRAAAMPETGWSGMSADCGIPEGSVMDVLCAAAATGMRVSMLGSEAVDIFWQVHQRVPISGQRWTIGHTTTLTDAQIARVKAMGVVLTMHTNAFLSNRGGEILERIGPARESEIVPLASLVRAGVPFGLGSDNVPVSLFGPIVSCVDRRERHRGAVIAADQSLSRWEALRAATLGGAYASFEEQQKGTIEVGKFADLAVLPDDPLTMPLDELAALRPDMTIVDGRIEYQADLR